MNDSQIARLLFFTRAAAEADPELAGARIGSPAMLWLGRAWTATPEVEKTWPPCTEITAPLSIAGIYRLWDDPESAGHCRCCGSRMLFLRLKGRYTPDCHGFHSGYCPFCDTDNISHPTGIGATTFRAVRRIVERIAAADAATPRGMSFHKAVAHLMELRDADLLDPAHPLEVASMERAHAEPPVLTGHKARECEEARIRAAIAPPELVARIAKARDEAEIKMYHELAACQDERDALSGDSPDSTPEARFKRGEMSREDYEDIKERMEILKVGADFKVGGALVNDNAVAAAEAELGRSLSKREQAVFIQALENYMAVVNRATWKDIKTSNDNHPVKP